MEYRNDEERQIAEQLLDLEMMALEKFMNGDTSLYGKLWAKDNFSYCDMGFDHRVDTREEIEQFLQRAMGLKTNWYEVKSPRVQFSTDGGVAILTYQLFAETDRNDMRYNCIETFDRQSDGQWRVIQSTWAVIRPFEMDFSKVRKRMGVDVL